MNWKDVDKKKPKNRETVIVESDQGLKLVCYYRETLGDFVSDHHLYKFMVNPLPEELEDEYTQKAIKWARI